jgi:hypothetical protein
MLVERRSGSKQSRLVSGAQTSIRSRALAKKRGYMNVHGRAWPLWTAEEDEMVRKLCPDYMALRKKLPGRTHYAIQMRTRTLGVSKHIHTWTGAEIARLRRLWSSADKNTILAAFPGLSWPKIRSTAKRRKFYRPERSFQPTGNSLLDQVRARCRYLKYTMRDLDALARTGNYFTRLDWKHGHQIAKVAKAAKALGGKISVSWED